MSRYPVRPAHPRDAKAIAEVHVWTWQAAHEGLVPEAHLQSLSVDKRQKFWRDAIEYLEPQLLVATDEERVVGFVGFDRSRDAGTPSTMGEIWALYVMRSHWGRGVGKALWTGAQDGLREEGCTDVSVWVPLAGERALHFYANCGFKPEPESMKTVDVGGASLEEVRLRRSVD